MYMGGHMYVGGYNVNRRECIHVYIHIYTDTKVYTQGRWPSV